jgi:hypothetical protein
VASTTHDELRDDEEGIEGRRASSDLQTVGLRGKKRRRSGNEGFSVEAVPCWNNVDMRIEKKKRNTEDEGTRTYLRIAAPSFYDYHPGFQIQRRRRFLRINRRFI